MADLVYRGLVCDEQGVREASIVITNGFIEGVHGPDYSVEAEEVLDYRSDHSVVAFPGFIDMHVHLRGFSQSYKETIESGTRAAAHGGITVVGDMPNTMPPIRSTRVLVEREDVLRRESRVDYYVYIGVPESSSELAYMTRRSVVAGLKLYPEDLRGGYIDLAKTIGHVLSLGKTVVVHPEEPYMIRECLDPLDCLSSRGVEAELWAVRRLAGFLQHSRVSSRVHVTHVTSPYTVVEALSRGFTLDTCPHYLLFGLEDGVVKQCFLKVYPPLRPKQYARLLLDMFVKGFIHAITSDHAPHAFYEKKSCYISCSGGVNGVEITVPFLATLVTLGFIDYMFMYRVLSRNPAEIIGLKRYGRLCRGCRGNLTLVRFGTKYVVESSRLYTKAEYSVYEGWVFQGLVEATVVGGEIVYSNGFLDDSVRGRAVGEVEGW